jgi:ATP-dependent DNA helicase RecG
MKATQVQIVINNFQKALLAEEKQGFTNTGVLGGFSVFLRGILPRLEQLFPGYDMDLLRKLAQNYPSWTPIRRREAFSELRRFLQEITLYFEQDSLVKKPSGSVNNNEFQDGPAGLREIRQTKEIIESKIIESKESKESKETNETLETREMIAAAKMRISKEFSKSLTENKAKDSDPSRPLQYLKGVGPERAKQLEKLGIRNVTDLLLYFPRRYEDRSRRMIAELRDGDLAALAGVVIAGQVIKGKLNVVKLSIDQQGRLFHATWFNQTFILKQYPVGTHVVVTGKVRWQQQVPEVLVTDIEKVSAGNLGGSSKQLILMPVYSETARLSSKVIRSIVRNVINYVEEVFAEIIPQDECQGWIPRSQAYREIHFPKDNESLAKARDRLAWEEVLLLQLAYAELRQTQVRLESPPLLGGEEQIQRFYNSLPFQLTPAQQRVIQEIFEDLSKPQGMARLVQGDVGSGKTAVAMAALLRAAGSGYQGAMMAPTEILALQHFQVLEKMFTPLGICVVCLLGNQSKIEREEVLAKVADGRAQVIVGTHALIQESVVFKALGLAITDEQHRFGVRQRSLLQNKGESPHVLVLTATPIPRTLALTLYGDLQLSVLDEMPVGRKSIITKKITERSRPKLERFMEEQMNSGRQIYVVCPLVEESETLDLISVMQRAVDLESRFPNRRVALLHGKMKVREKETIMDKFRENKINILVSTTVVEVGVNIPNASVMVIESAERFGLAQLHQLRGRVGRGNAQSYCFLMSENKDSRRLDILCQTDNGFTIAEEDMKLRGTGELLGTRQHGLGQLQLADLSKDGYLVEKAYQMTQKALKNPEKFRLLFQEVRRKFPPEKIGIN